jgi:hypothetical protein
MDEHIQVSGQIEQFDADISDINLNSISWWTAKHNSYAGREAVDLLLVKEHDEDQSQTLELSFQARTQRWLKSRFYARLPIGSRAFAYFLYRYVVRLGFLDGWPGLAFHFLQGCWYRFLVDVKVFEVQRAMSERRITLREAVLQELGLKLDDSSCTRDRGSRAGWSPDRAMPTV